MAFNYEFPYTDPNLYNDDWLLSRVKELKAMIDELETWKTDFQDEYEQFMTLMAQIESGNFPPSIKNAFYQWMQLNAVSLVGELVHNVFFGITDDGHFVAYIPDSWSDIIFNTTYYDIVLSAHPEYGYGHLVLSY